MLKIGYISNGFADHSLEQMAELLRRFGYQGIGITLGFPHLDPFHVSRARLAEVRRLLEAGALEPVIETGARYVLDPHRKHRPSLVSVDAKGREQRIAYYRRAVEIAAELGAPLVSLWSGTPQPGIHADRSWTRLVEGLRTVCDYAAERGVQIGFEPEPGMFVENLAGWRSLRERLPHPALGLTIDVGHLAVTEQEPWAAHLESHVEDLIHVHLDDTRDRRHEHLPFGEGTIDFDAIIAALLRIEYGGVALVELSRHSHVAPLVAQRSMLFLRSVETRARTGRDAGGTSRPEGESDR